MLEARLASTSLPHPNLQLNCWWLRCIMGKVGTTFWEGRRMHRMKMIPLVPLHWFWSLFSAILNWRSTENCTSWSHPLPVSFTLNTLSETAIILMPGKRLRTCLWMWLVWTAEEKREDWRQIQETANCFWLSVPPPSRPLKCPAGFLPWTCCCQNADNSTNKAQKLQPSFTRLNKLSWVIWPKLVQLSSKSHAETN